MRNRFDPYAADYSTLNLATCGVLALIGWGLLSYLGYVVPGWVWWGSLVLSLIGVVMHFLTRRVLFIRMYQTFSLAILSLAFGIVVWAVLNTGQSVEQSVLLGIAVGLTLVIVANIAYSNNRTRYSRTRKNPVGWVGSLDTRTARIYREDSKAATEAAEATAESVSKVRRYGPVIAGLSYVFVRTLSADYAVLVIGLVAFGIAYGTAFGTGSVWYLLRQAVTWEREHGKRIYVQR